MCTYPASATTITQHGQCVVSGQDVLDVSSCHVAASRALLTRAQYLEFGGIPMGAYAGILIGIVVIYRVA